MTFEEANNLIPRNIKVDSDVLNLLEAYNSFDYKKSDSVCFNCMHIHECNLYDIEFPFSKCNFFKGN